MILQTYNELVRSFGSSEFVVYYDRNRMAVVCADLECCPYIKERDKPLKLADENHVKVWSWTHDRPIVLDVSSIRKMSLHKY